MGNTYSNYGVSPANITTGTLSNLFGEGEPSPVPRIINRQRILELNKLALDCIDYLYKRGMSDNEWCVFGDIIKRLHEYPDFRALTKKGKKRAASKQ